VSAGEIGSGLDHYRAHGRKEGRLSHAATRSVVPCPKIAIITMVYNESFNLPIWIKHYRRTAPNANLFVVDHSSDDGSTDNLSGVNKIALPRDKLDEVATSVPPACMVVTRLGGRALGSSSVRR
jgi:hypothetical protein